jgi:uncharacterized protein (DUF4415 family)
MKTHIGTDIFDKFIKNTKDYQDEVDFNKQKKMKDEAFGKWMAYLLIQSSDQGKYGSLMDTPVSQFSMDENNQHLKSIRAAIDILSNHKHNWRGTQKKEKNKKDWFKSNK